MRFAQITCWKSSHHPILYCLSLYLSFVLFINLTVILRSSPFIHYSLLCMYHNMSTICYFIVIRTVMFYTDIFSYSTTKKNEKYMKKFP